MQSYQHQVTAKGRRPLTPHPLGSEELQLIRQHVDVNHGELCLLPSYHSVWGAVTYLLGQPEDKAIRDLRNDFDDYTEDEARAAWLLVNAVPRQAQEMRRQHTGDREYRFVRAEEPDVYELLGLDAP